MEFIIHRVNSIEELRNIPNNFGCEIDIRTDGSKLILNHDPFESGDSFIDYIDNYKNGTLILNIKESGIEDIVLHEVRKRNINSYFLLDVEFPYLFSASLKGEKNIAVRFSEKEPIENSILFKNRVNWVLIDTITKLPVDNSNKNHIENFKSCLVSPGRWGRKYDIIKYLNFLSDLNFDLDSLLISKNNLNEIKKFL